MQEDFAGVTLVVTRPTQAVERFETLVAHPGVPGRQLPHLVPHRLRVIGPFVAKLARQADDDPEIVAGFGGRIDRLADALHAPLAVGDGAFRFERAGRRGKHDVGALRGLGQENVLDDQEVEAFDQFRRTMLIGL